MIQQTARVLWNRRVAPSYYRMGLDIGKGYIDAVPGQFVTLKAGDSYEPLLRRPFSIHRLIMANGDNVRGLELLYKVVGKSTRQLSQLRENHSLNMLGPLGNGFSLPEPCREILMIAGGIGVAPLLFLAESMTRHEKKAERTRILIGGRTEHDLLCVDDFHALNMETRLATDDGSCGHKGLITDLLEAALEETKPDMIFACGPHAMLNAVAERANSLDIRCQVSLETIMVCGMGACLGCAVPVSNDSGRYGHVCADGPVFDSRVIRTG